MKMKESKFDFEILFDQDYLYFYETFLTPERTEQEVEMIWNMLKLNPGESFLDLACGHGRIASRLAARGCSVTGLDSSSIFLDLAQHSANARSVVVEYVKGDMRSLPWNERFDYIVSWFTAFGYFNDDDNLRVLSEVYRALKPGGKLLIDHQNRDFIIRNFQSTMLMERDKNFLLDRNQYDVFTGRIYTERIIFRDKQFRRMNYFIRFFTYTELRDWLLQAGFSQVKGYGDGGKTFRLDSRRMIVVAYK